MRRDLLPRYPVPYSQTLTLTRSSIEKPNLQITTSPQPLTVSRQATRDEQTRLTIGKGGKLYRKEV